MRRRLWSCNPRLNHAYWTCRLEPLEIRALFSVSPGIDQPLGWDGAMASTVAEYQLGFDKDPFALEAASSALLSDATPTGTSYLLYENWGGTWWDAEKTPANTEDDLMCWAAAASNILAWTGWGAVGGMTNADQIFAYFQNHWTDEGGLMQYGWDWWFDGSNNSQGFTGWSQVDVTGGGFYPTESFSNYFRSNSNTSTALSSIASYLQQGYGVTLGIYGPGGHAITCWGYNYDPANPTNYLGLWITDSDDSKSLSNPPDVLHYYEVANVNGQWFLQDYYGSDAWYIGAVHALAPKEATPTTPPDSNDIRGTVWQDTNGDGQHQAGENGLADQTVYLDQNNNGQFDSSTTTVTSSTIKAIPDAGSTASTMSFTGTGLVTDINVTVNITHPYDSDLTVYLISPQGTRVTLFSGVGGSGDNFVNTVLDDEAATAIDAGLPAFTGRFRPDELLSRFDGENANGTWTLEVYDDYAADTGTLNSWSLEITSGERATQTNADGAYAFTGLAEGTYAVRHQTAAGWQGTYPVSGVHQVSLQGEAVANVDFMATQSSLPNSVNLGVVDYQNLVALNPSAGDYWYSLQAARQGYLTLEAFVAGGSATLTLHDTNGNLLATSMASEGGQRIDWQVAAGQTYLVRVSGTSTNVDLRLANLVARNGNAVTIYGTSGDDLVELAAAAWHQVTINEVHYQFDSSVVTSLSFDGGAGANSAVLCTAAGDGDEVKVWPRSATVVGTGYLIEVANVPDIVVLSGGGLDSAYLYDSSGDDTLLGYPDHAQLSGSGFCNWVGGFRNVYSIANAGGFDLAYLYDSAGNDAFTGRPEYSILAGDTFYVRAQKFESVFAFSTAGGQDTAKLIDSAGNDVLRTTDDYARLTGPGYRIQVKRFEEVTTYCCAGGLDTGIMDDSRGNDTLTAGPTEAVFQVGAFTYRVNRIERLTVNSKTGGIDSADLYDSAGDDSFLATSYAASLSGPRYSITAARFESVTAHATAGGIDSAQLEDSSGNDTFVGDPTAAVLSGTGFSNRVELFENVYAFAKWGGVDIARLYGSAGDDLFVLRPNEARMRGDSYYLFAKFFEQVYGDAGTGGDDLAYFTDSSGNDHLVTTGSRATLNYAAAGFVQADGFGRVRVTGSAGGVNTKQVGAIDFVLETPGLWVDL